MIDRTVYIFLLTRYRILPNITNSSLVYRCIWQFVNMQKQSSFLLKKVGPRKRVSLPIKKEGPAEDKVFTGDFHPYEPSFIQVKQQSTKGFSKQAIKPSTDFAKLNMSDEQPL